MIGLAIVSVIAAVGLGVLAWRWRNGAQSIVLAALPIALLLVVLPIPVAIWGMIRGFQRISASGTSGILQVTALSLNVSTALFWGSVGFIVVMIGAAAVQALAGRDASDAVSDVEPSVENPTSNTSTGLAEGVVLVASSLLVLPTVGLIQLTAGVPRLVMSTAQRLEGSTQGSAAVGGESVGEVSALISSRLASAFLGGGLLSILLLIAGTGTLVAIRARQPSRVLTLYSWIVLAICVPLAVWNAIQLIVDIRGFQIPVR